MAQDDLVARAQDPATPLATLQQLAQEYPGLRPAIAANPSTYPALLEWLGDLGDPAIDAALAARSAGTGAVSAASAAGAETTELPPSLPPTTSPQPTGPVPAVGPTSAPSNAWQTGDNGVFGVGVVEPVTPGAGRPAPQRNRTFMWVAVAVAVGIVALLLGWFLGAMGTRDAETSVEPAPATTGAPGPATAEAPATQAQPTPTPTPSPTVALVAPAPAGAMEMSSFTAPSGNITCTLTDTSVNCTINSYEFDTGGTPSCSGTDVPFTASVGDTDHPVGACGTSFAPSGATLEYGSSAKNDTFACTSSEDGVSCWSQVSGQGFLIRRDGVTPQTH